MKIKTLLIVLMFIAGVIATITPVSATSQMPRITKEDARQKIDDPDVIFLDVRTGSDWRASGLKIQGAVYEEVRNFDKWIENYDPEKTYIVYCAWPGESSSARMAERMQAKGFENVYALKGGWHEWQRADFPTEPK